jgi:hypothetical protein
MTISTLANGRSATSDWIEVLGLGVGGGVLNFLAGEMSLFNPACFNIALVLASMAMKLCAFILSLLSRLF